jgi:hypothetical protein
MGGDRMSMPRGQQVTLELLKVGVRRLLSSEFVNEVGSFTRESVTIEARMADYIAQSLAVDLRAFVLGKKSDVYTETSKPLTLEITVPATPWHMFRQTHGSAWWMRWLRTPIRYTTHRRTGTMSASLTRYLTYPAADVPYREFGAPVTVWRTDSWVESVRDWLDDEPVERGESE